MNDLTYRLYDLTVDEYVYFSESYAPNFRHDGIILDLDGDDFSKLCCNLAGAGVGYFNGSSIVVRLVTLLSLIDLNNILVVINGDFVHASTLRDCVRYVGAQFANEGAVYV